MSTDMFTDVRIFLSVRLTAIQDNYIVANKDQIHAGDLVVVNGYGIKRLFVILREVEDRKVFTNTMLDSNELSLSLSIIDNDVLVYSCTGKLGWASGNVLTIVSPLDGGSR